MIIFIFIVLFAGLSNSETLSIIDETIRMQNASDGSSSPTNEHLAVIQGNVFIAANIREFQPVVSKNKGQKWTFLSTM